ncbi:MAG: cysteine methyltransferase [Thermotoga sp.]|nr:MAG: cysteine methyltransferase [Thermotoga sp.]HDM69922.1 methylated-DNA--[protein]-cysteine S-methyltransferase [Thermotogales bacterium]
MMKMKLSYVETELGKIAILTDSTGLKVIRISFNPQDLEQTIDWNEVEIYDETLASMEIRRYIDGKLREFTVEPILNGTKFQIAVWKETMKIPYGSMRTYSQVAELVGNKRAAKAVGNALRMNRIPIIVPCHRVIAKTGLGGFSAGLRWKTWLLELEGAIVP